MSEKVKLSASRIKTLQSCSWIYNCNYNLKLPQKNNSGAIRGTIAHLIFEVLSEERRRAYVEEILNNGTCLRHKSITRLIFKLAIKNNLDLDEEVAPLKKGGEKVTNLNCIDQMIMVGLKFDFIDTIKLIGSEIEFDINNDTPSYRIGGFIDRVFESDGNLIIRDFKSSKQQFKGEDLTSNIQAMIYALAMSKKYGKSYNDIIVKFLFLRFPDNPEKECPKFSEQELIGFEYFLEYISNYISTFNETSAKSNLAANSYDRKWMCQTKSGWRCPYLDSFGYKVLIDKNKKIVKSIFADQDFKETELKDGFSIEERFYSGCPAWQKNSNKEFDF